MLKVVSTTQSRCYACTSLFFYGKSSWQLRRSWTNTDQNVNPHTTFTADPNNQGHYKPVYAKTNTSFQLCVHVTDILKVIRKLFDQKQFILTGFVFLVTCQTLNTGITKLRPKVSHRLTEIQDQICPTSFYTLAQIPIPTCCHN